MKDHALPGVRKNPSPSFRDGNPDARQDPLDRGQGRRRSVFSDSAVRERTSVSERREPSWRMTGGASRRNHHGAPLNALHGRTPRVSALPPRRAEAASGRRRNPRLPGARKPYVPREVPTSRGDEPLPLRIFGRSGKTVRVFGDGGGKIPQPDILTAHGPHRPFRGSSPAVVFGNRDEIARTNGKGDSRKDGPRPIGTSRKVWKPPQNQRLDDVERLGDMRIFQRGDGARPRIRRSAGTLRPSARPHPKSRPHHRGFGRIRFRRSRTRGRSGGVSAEIVG